LLQAITMVCVKICRLWRCA